MRERWARIAIAIGLLVAAAFVLSGRGPGKPLKVCADVGLGTDTYGATPREALEAYVRSRGGDPKYWRLVGDAGFEVRDARAKPKGLGSIGASQTEPGVWRVTGGCVGNYGPPRPTHARVAMSNSTCDASAFRVEAKTGRSQPPFATWEFALTNVSDRACTVRGYPSVGFHQNDYPLSFSVLRRGGVLIDEPKPRDVALAPNATAYFVVEKDACAPTDSIVAGTATVFIRGAGGLRTTVPGRFTFCGHTYNDDTVSQTALVGDVALAYRAVPATQRCRAKDLRAELAGDSTVDGMRTWTERLANIGATPCELRGTPGLYFYGPEIGLKYQSRPAGAPVLLAPGAAAQLSFAKRDCVRPETPITAAKLRPPADQGLVDLPVPPGLQKCDFKDPGNNVIRFGPFAAT